MHSSGYEAGREPGAGFFSADQERSTATEDNCAVCFFLE
jgi:hypothetical protein